MSKQILRIEPIKNTRGFTAKWKHNYRVWDVPNADPQRRDLNRQLITIPANETYTTFFRRRIAEQPYYDNHSIRKNATLGLEVMMSYSPNDLPEGFSIEHWAEQSAAFLKAYFGAENVASAVLHMDEGTPHIHAVVIPINEEGRLSARSYIADREGMRNMHRTYYEYMEECGLEPENNYIHTTHDKIGKFYGNINMALEQNLPGPEEGESLTDYAARANEFYKEQSLRMFARENELSKLKRSQKTLENANKALADKLNGVLKTIGSVENAVNAIQYRDNLLNAIELTKHIDPELAYDLEESITNMQVKYQRHIESKAAQEITDHEETEK